jgi:hypothetical protein
MMLSGENIIDQVAGASDQIVFVYCYFANNNGIKAKALLP